MSLGEFEYNPRREELLKQTESEKPCKIRYESVEQSGKRKNLSLTQKEFIASVINNNVSLSTNKDHHMRIEVLGEYEFSVVIDHADKFHIVKREKEEDSLVVVQERIKTKSFVNSIRDFFQAIANLFYQPTYPSKELKQRTHRETVKQDFRALRKSLENGKQWLSSAGSIRKGEKKELEKEIGGLIINAKKIEHALDSKNQTKALDELSERFAQQIFDLNKESSFTLATGYRNQDGALQPVMLHFSNTKEGGLILEIYADTHEGKGKIAPLHRRKFHSNSVTQPHIKAVLDEAFKPLISPKTHTKALKKAVKPSNTFGAITRSQIEPRLQEEIKKVSKRKETAEERFESPQEERVTSLTFERFMRSVDTSMKGTWDSVEIGEQKMKRQPETPSERVAGWFNHLLGEQKLHKNEKLNLLFFLTEDYAQDQMRQLERKPPRFRKPSPEKQLAVYKNVAEQIAHMRERLAVSINGDHMLDTRGIPQSLKNTEELCQKKIAHLESKIRDSKRAGMSKILSKTQSSKLSGITVGSVNLEPPVDPAATMMDASLAVNLDEAEWMKEWQSKARSLEELLSPEKMVQQRNWQIVREFNDVKKRSIQRFEDAQDQLEELKEEAKDYDDLEPEKKDELIQKIMNSPVPLSEKDKKTLEIPNNLNADSIQEIIENLISKSENLLESLEISSLIKEDKVDEESLDKIIQAIFGSMDKEALAFLGTSRQAGINQDQLASIIRQLIICPQMLPTIDTPNGKSILLQEYLEVIYRILDPQLASGSPYASITDDLRALINIRHLLPRKKMGENYQKLWEEQLELKKKKSEEKVEHKTADLIKATKENVDTFSKKLEELNQSEERNPQEIAKTEKALREYEMMLKILEPLSEEKGIFKKFEKLKTQIESIKEEVKDTDQEEIFKEILTNLKNSEGLYTFLEIEKQFLKMIDSHPAIPETLTPSNLEEIDESPAPDLEKLEPILEAFGETVNAMAAHLQQLSKDISREPDPFKKQAMYEEIKTRSLELLAMLPPPGTDGAHGTPSIWRSLTAEQRVEMRRNVQQLEHHIWEAQMRLSKTDLSGKEKFLMIKGQAIGMALIREDVKEEQKKIEKFLTDLYTKTPEEFKTFANMEGIDVLESEGRVIINLEKLDPKTIKDLARFIAETREQFSWVEDLNNAKIQDRDKDSMIDLLKQCLIKNNQDSFKQNGINWNADKKELIISWNEKELDWGFMKKVLENNTILMGDLKINPLLLLLDARTLDTHGLNCVLTQDLTTCLSLDPKLEREVQAVYHFVVTDQNRGKSDRIYRQNNKATRSPLLRQSATVVVNPLLRELSLLNILSNGNKRQVESKIKELQKTHNIDVSKLKAIKWDEKNKNELLIDWDNPELEKDLAAFAEHDSQIKMALDFYTAVNQAAKNELYFNTASDPDFTLYAEESEEPSGRSFFQKRPNLLIGKQSPIDLHIHPSQQGLYTIKDESGKVAAEVHIYGKQGESDRRSFGAIEEEINEDQLHLAMKPKKPFLPTTNQPDPFGDPDGFGSNEDVREIRVLKSYDAWSEYVKEIAGGQVLSIPTQVLGKLFQIRQAPNDSRQGIVVASYSSDTALLALDFLTDISNQPHIQHDFVQNFLLESLFGPMVLQQSLIDHPEAFISHIKSLEQAILQAQTSRNHEMLGFYTLILNRLEGHINEARNQLQNQGVMAGSLSKLPVFRDKHGLGAIYRHVQQATELTHVINREDLDTEAIIQPLTAKLYFLELCHMEISSIERDSAITVKNILLSGEKGQRPIDKITNPEAKRRAYTHLLQYYYSMGIGSLDDDDYLEILKGYELLQSPSTEAASSLISLEQEAASWIRQDVLPAIQSMEEDKRDGLLKQIVNAKLKAEKKDPLSDEARFKATEGKINQFELSTGVQEITIHLSTMEIGGIELTKETLGSAAIPEKILKRKDVQQALGTSIIKGKITKTERGKTSTYTWEHQGQEFTLRTDGFKVDIKRKISSHSTLPSDEYTFYPVQLENIETHAEHLLNANGIWKIDKQPKIGYVFGSGMELPTTETIYQATMNDTNNISFLSTLGGARVGSATRLNGPSPLLFADTKHTLILVDPQTGRPNELRIPGLNVAMRKTENRWQLSQSGKPLGMLKVPGRDEEKFLRTAFGEHWDQFVVPVEREVDKIFMKKGEKITTKRTETVYLMIPYRQQVDRKGQLSVDQSMLDTIPGMHELRMTEEGKVQGTMAANVYLAHRFLLQAGKTSNPTIARNLMMKAQEHLERVQGQPAPSNPQEVENLRFVLAEIAATPAVSLSPPPTLEALSMALKLELFVQHIRSQAVKQKIKTLQSGSEQELNELFKIAQMYQAYTVLEETAAKKGKLHRDMFALTDKEDAALIGINKRMLQGLSSAMENQELYFGTTGRLATTVSLDRPKTIDPQFLLALLRMAKPRNPEITLKGVNAPLPAANLIENFWSYLTSIKTNRLTTEDLMFLFEESILPPTDSPEQEQQLRELDLQARQFLLTMADLIEQAGGSTDIMGDAEKFLEESKAHILTTEQKDLGSLLSNYKGMTGIKTNFDSGLKGIEELKIDPVPDTDPPIPDLDKLIYDLNNKVKTPLGNFKDQLEDALNIANKQISEIRARDEKLQEEIFTAKKSLEKAIDDHKEGVDELGEEEYEEKIHKLQEAVKNAIKEHLNYTEEEILDPLTGEKLPRSAFVSNEYAESVFLEDLKKVAEQTRSSIEKLDDAIQEIGEKAGLLKSWNELEECMRDIETVPFKRNDWFDMPEAGAAKAFIEYQLQQTGEEPSLFSAGISLIRQLGPVTAIRLARSTSEYETLSTRLKETDKELRTDNLSSERKKELQGKRAKIMQKLLSNPQGNLEAAGMALGSLVTAGAILDFKPIEYKPETIKKVGEQTVSEEILNDPFFKKCFTDQEREQIASNLSRMGGYEKRTYVKQLQAALNMQASLLNASLGLQSRIESINKSLGKVLKGTHEGKSDPTPHSFKGITGTSLEQRYADHYTSKTGFVAKEKLAALFKKLEETTKRNEDTLDFLKNRAENLADPLFSISLEEVNDTINEIRKRIQPQPIPIEIEPYIDALALIGKAAVYKIDGAKNFADQIRKISTGEELLLAIQTAHDQLAPLVAKHEHEALISEIIDQTMPKDSHYADEYSKGLERIEKNNPLAYSTVIGEDQVEDVEELIATDVAQLQEQVKQQQDEIIRRLEAVSLGNLPKSLQKIRMRRGSSQELLEAAYKEYRKGSFQESKPTIPDGAFKELDLDTLIGKTLFDDTRRQVLQGSRFNAFTSIQNLYVLREEKKELMRLRAIASQYTKEKLENKIKKFVELAKESTSKQENEELRKEIEGLRNALLHYDDFNTLLARIESKWQKESDKIRDFTGRCQSQPHLQKDLGSLAPYTRHINYLQQRLGLVLREDQVQTLQEIIDNPALLKQLRMGLGKTSVILPFALMILSAKGYNAIGMVPKALFDTNFDEMDETTRAVFEMAGSRFLFSRQDANFPLDKLSLNELSTKCAEFFDALNREEYILTTIESKASLDNKIIEVERSQAFIQSRINDIKENEDISEEDKQKRIEAFYPSLYNHQMALDMLYRVKAVFEAKHTRLIIDEVDSVAKSNKTVNSEIGRKDPIAPAIQNVASEIFDIIRENPELEGLLEQIQSNNQFTLNESQVNDFIKKIGEVLIQNIDLQGHKKDEVLNWLTGETACPFDAKELKNLGAAADKLKIQRKALNSALRSSLALKAGLSGDFDPTHGAIGVPASQGVTSKTTKYSDPLMQVVLTQMIALYKPQGEAYLNAVAKEVIADMKSDLKIVEGQLKEASSDSLKQKRDELKEGIKKLSKLAIPEILRNELKQELAAKEGSVGSDLEKEIENLEEYIDTLSPDSPPSYQNAIKGSDPLNTFLRLRFARAAAKRGMIYVSNNEVSRPNQHALRGCHVIGLTGTATENTSHVITGTGHQEAMKGITETGRDSTAEVVYRFVKALKKGSETPAEILKRPVETYSLDTKKALEQFINIAQKESGYRFLINQAGACDELTLREITQQLHVRCERPIVYLDMDEEGRTEKVALINGVRRPLKDLSREEKQQVEEEGFTYYHTPHVRGTHFDLPGSKGAIMLSPTVNANDRDQAFYRARGLGEEHTVVPFISEKQSAEFKEENGEEMKLRDLLKIQHEQTREEESQEDLAAYVLHIKGQVILAADRAKERIQLKDGSIKSFSDWTEADQEKITARAKVNEIVERLFIRETGNSAYLSSLNSETRQGGTMPTNEYLTTVVIEQELARIDRFLKEIDEIKTENDRELKTALDIVTQELSQAKKKLEEEQKNIEENWEETLSRKLPTETSSAPATQETSETEAEAEAEAVAETTSESTSDTERKKRTVQTRNILTVPDHDLLNSLQQSPKKFMTYQYLPDFRNTHEGWKSGIRITENLKHAIEIAGGQGKGIEIKALIIDEPKEGEQAIILSNAADIDNLIGHMSILLNSSSRETSGFSVKPWFNEEGEMELQYCDTSLTGYSLRDEFDEKKELKGEIYLSFIHLGFSPISEKGWEDIGAYWTSLDKDAQDEVKNSLEKTLTSSNPSLLDSAAKHMWNKPKSEAISLGGSKASVDKISDIDEAKKQIKEAVEDPYAKTKYNAAQKWIDRNADDLIKEELEKWAGEEY
ncbi:hypothetical protein [Waddlia chondrophila]|uniref:Uncharacterized protein n=1 Tax=Waddlia chondrophila (strain ATCC VR-1470 / WSU 86-1044) TaxID=716544 RepID=D6YVB0_WADCW|nr:hypothetical protein [Waddlia chondrophila]ADI38071.1 hypothetical protein wcw_0704 [Waddlia chondrophila WSU 86-1044]